MQANQLRPAKEFAIKYGCKSIGYGAPGSGKTPVSNTAPRPVLLACEPGLLSMRNSDVPTFAAFHDTKKCDEFFQWVFNSAEIKNYDTVIVDSASFMCEMYLEWAKSTVRDGRAQYGRMAEAVMKHMTGLYYLQEKHIYLICKQEILHTGERRPAFPGQQLHSEIPHLYDLIMNIDMHSIPSVGIHKAFLTKDMPGYVARDRSGSLNQFEATNLNDIFNKVMNPNL